MKILPILVGVMFSTTSYASCISFARTSCTIEESGGDEVHFLNLVSHSCSLAEYNLSDKVSQRLNYLYPKFVKKCGGVLQIHQTKVIAFSSNFNEAKNLNDEYLSRCKNTQFQTNICLTDTIEVR